MNKFKLLLLLILLVAGISSCKKKNELQSGIWRGELAVSGDKKVPFLFEVEKNGIDSITFTLLNGEERVELPGVMFHGDTLIVPIEAYDAEIRGLLRMTVSKENSLKITSKTIRVFPLPRSTV